MREKLLKLAIQKNAATHRESAVLNLSIKILEYAVKNRQEIPDWIDRLIREESRIHCEEYKRLGTEFNELKLTGGNPHVSIPG